MKGKFKVRFKKKIIGINLLSIFFFAMSLISITFAWFAFSKVVSSDMDIDVRAWSIDINDGTDLSNDLNIEIDSLSPGMETYDKTITINNEGDIDADLSFVITYLRIYYQEYDVTNQSELFERLNQDFPFEFNFVLSEKILKAGNSATFNIQVSWELDSGNDELDTYYGNQSSIFKQSEIEKKKMDSSYTMKTPIELRVNLKTQQHVENNSG